MRKIIGIGETILDIIFQNEQPHHSVPGGSTFNAMISLGRLRQNLCFLSELGNDKVGETICRFMEENNLSTQYISRFSQGKSPISLAFLNEQGNAQYEFYAEYPENRLDVAYPKIDENDLVLIGSYFAVNPALRERVADLLSYARDRKAIIYYDINFRKAHAHQALWLMPSLIENLEYADIVRGSSEDFDTLYHLTDAQKIYRDKIEFYTPRFIYTDGANGVDLFSHKSHYHYDALPTKIVSTIGAGDNFNAGILYGLLREDITREQLDTLPEETWRKLINYGLHFSAHVCSRFENYLSEEFAQTYLTQ